MPDLIYNNDSDNIFSYHRHDMSPQVVDERVDIVAESGANIFIQDVCAQKTNFDSKVWESWLTGFDPDGGPNQPLFEGLEAEAKQGTYEQHMAMLKIRELGIDYTGRTLERCRDMGMSPWISVRLNDHHGTAPEPLFKTVSTFWLEHPEYRLHTDRKTSRGFQTLNYAEPEVHDRYRRLITEVLERYDIEGLELDAMRSPFVFRIGREYENRHVMTQWIAEVRSMLDTAAKKRGHRIDLAVRLASRPDTARRFGFDVASGPGRGQ